MKIFRDGFLVGLILQLAIGPVFFFIANIVLQKGIVDGFAAVVGVTLVDFLFILLAIFGVGKLIGNEKSKKILGMISSVVLVVFGILMIKSLTTETVFSIAGGSDPMSSFLKTFLLTILSPLSIVFWTGIFMAKAVEKDYSKKQLPVFGLGAGSATFFFMSLNVIFFSFVRTIIPISVIQTLNVLVGCLLIGYGVYRFWKIVRNKNIKN